MRKCHTCGTEVSESAKNCPICLAINPGGQNVTGTRRSPSGSKKLSIWDARIGGDFSKSREQHVCTRCGHVGYPEIVSPANGCVAILLLLFFIIPGIIYLAWAATAPRVIYCKKCGGKDTMIPLAAQQAARMMNPQPASAPRAAGFCSSCGKYFQDATAAFCPLCGVPQRPSK